MMRFISSVSLFLLIAGKAVATPGPTLTDDLIFVPSLTSEPSSDAVSSPTLAPSSYVPLSVAIFPVRAPMAVAPVRSPVPLPRDDAPTALRTGAPITPPPSTLTPTAAVDPLTMASNAPSLVPSSFQTIAPSVTPAETPIKKPTNGAFISSVKVTGLRLRLVNAGTLLETNRWRVQTEKLYNGYFEDTTCSVSFVKSEVSDQDGQRVNTITYDLVLQSEFLVITDSELYAVEPFEDQAANVQYGNALRKLINFERLALPISAPIVPKRTDDESGDKNFVEKLGMHVFLGILAAGLSGLFICLCCCNRARRQRQLSKKPEEPTSTFRISSDEDVSTIGPIEDVVDSELGESELTEDDYSSAVESPNFRRKVILNIGRVMCMTGAATTEEARDDEEETNYPRGELMDVFAPAGKLGIIINTPDEGPPVIHIVKEHSSVLDQLCVDDRLIAIDDEDVQTMTAVQVSQIISSKSSNPQRKFTIVRPHDVIDI